MITPPKLHHAMGHDRGLLARGGTMRGWCATGECHRRINMHLDAWINVGWRDRTVHTNRGLPVRPTRLRAQVRSRTFSDGPSVAVLCGHRRPHGTAMRELHTSLYPHHRAACCGVNPTRHRKREHWHRRTGNAHSCAMPGLWEAELGGGASSSTRVRNTRLHRAYVARARLVPLLGPVTAKLMVSMVL